MPADGSQFGYLIPLDAYVFGRGSKNGIASTVPVVIFPNGGQAPTARQPSVHRIIVYSERVYVQDLNAQACIPLPVQGYCLRCEIGVWCGTKGTLVSWDHGNNDASCIEQAVVANL